MLLFQISLTRNSRSIHTIWVSIQWCHPCISQKNLCLPKIRSTTVSKTWIKDWVIKTWLTNKLWIALQWRIRTRACSNRPIQLSPTLACTPCTVRRHLSMHLWLMNWRLIIRNLLPRLQSNRGCTMQMSTILLTQLWAIPYTKQIQRKRLKTTTILPILAGKVHQQLQQGRIKQALPFSVQMSKTWFPKLCSAKTYKWIKTSSPPTSWWKWKPAPTTNNSSIRLLKPRILVQFTTPKAVLRRWACPHPTLAWFNSNSWPNNSTLP